MDHLLSHYEYELGLFARALGDFAIRYPKIATRLGIQSGQTDDPHVARLIQTFSFLAAHLDSKLADDYPEFTEALLEVVHPHYLRTIPSCAIALVEQRWPHSFGQLSEIFKWSVRGNHAADLIAGSVAKYASSGV